MTDNLEQAGASVDAAAATVKTEAKGVASLLATIWIKIKAFFAKVKAIF